MHKNLEANKVFCGDARAFLPRMAAESVSCSIWSPPYFVGKEYESYLRYFEDWCDLLETVVRFHFPIIKPGGFLVINIADILCFKDREMPRIQAENITHRRSQVTKQDVVTTVRKNPGLDRRQIASMLGCSEQTVDRRLNGNNIRGGKYATQTRVKLVAGEIEKWATAAGFYCYDRRVWIKDPAWQNSEWHTTSYRAVDEFEHLLFFWKPGSTTVDRSRLTPREWAEWGSRAVWYIPSVRANDDHEAKFPLELPRRIIRMLTAPDDLVLDCFAGSGTTGVAAAAEKRQFIGIELHEKYATAANNALQVAIRSRRTAFSEDTLAISNPLL
jgi:DNA modification methylase